jgi:hypothetical protein
VQRVPVTSRSLRSVGYDPDQRRLELEFRSGKVYEYDEVPAPVHEWLMRVPNKGGFVTRLITPTYRYRELGVPRAAVCRDLEGALIASLKQLDR